MINANTTLDQRLHLVDFTKTSPSTLKQLMTDSIDAANSYLDKLENTDSTCDSQTALDKIQAFDYLNSGLERYWGLLSHLNAVISNDEIRHIHHEALPILSAFSTRLGQHKQLFDLYNNVYTDKPFLKSLSQARRRSIELAIKEFQLSGIALPQDKQKEYATIQSELSTLSAKFSDNILDATQAFALPLTDSQLAGITESGKALLANAGEQYKKKLKKEALQNTENNQNIAKSFNHLPETYYVATLDIPVYLSIMTHADDRNLREAMYKSYVTRASEHDVHTNTKGESLNNADNISRILTLRQQKSALLGFDNYCQLSLAVKMADSSTQIETFLRDLADKATPFAQQDLQELTAIAQEFDINDIQPWDVSYLAEKVKQRKFNLSQEEIRPYFPLKHVITGLFNIVNKLYDIKIIENSQDVPLWHDDVRFYQIFDTDDTLLGGFYFDLYTRQGKRGGAWMSGFQSRYHYKEENHSQLPVCFMVCNFSPATSEQPSLLTHNEVLTLFHEFGHGLHHLLTTVDVSDVAGTNGVEWDAVELPSQFMENWAWQNEGIALISSHIDTAQPLPDEKLTALLNAKNFQSGMQTLRQIEFALFDLLLHTKNDMDYDKLLTLLNQVRKDVAVMATPDYNRFANGFSHIFAGGYACGYYSYKWAELLSADAFAKFEENGIFNKQTGNQFRECILATGGSQTAATNFEAFRSRPANINALLRHSGFTSSK